jgi:sugar/nucleoside kinase (ribokinase family)
MSGSRILVIGDVMTDIIVIPDGPIVRGSDRRAKVRSRPGGSGANQAVWLGSMGANVRFAARVAETDRAGLEAHFRSRHVEPVLTGDATTPSGVLVTIIDADGERSFLTDRGANLNLSAEDLPPGLLDDVRLVLTSGYSYFEPGPREAVMGLLKEAKVRGIATAIDPASVGFLREVGTDQFLRWTAGLGTIFANVDEALALTGSSDLNFQMQTLSNIYSRVIIKRGSAGAAIGGRGGVALSLPAVPTDVVDTTGAGDAFAAAFLVAEVKGGDDEACLRAGLAAAAEAVSRIGGQMVV